MNADGTNVQQLTNPDHVYYDEYPSISSDGKTIVFNRYPADESTGEDIWTANIDGSNAKQLTTDGLSFDPMFIKDKIVFVSPRDNMNTTEVYSMNVDGTNQQRLTNDSVSEYFDRW
jgi:Tol biopolymer transport system component